MVRVRRLFGLAKKVVSEFDTESSATIDGRPARHTEIEMPMVSDSGPTWQDYEKAAAAYLRQKGFANVVGNTAGADGGIDVRVPGQLVGQVKFEQSKTGRPVVMQIFGVAAQEQCKAVFFSHAGYTKTAIDWANSAPVALFQLHFSKEDERWKIRAINKSAQQLRPLDHLGISRSERGPVDKNRGKSSGLIKPKTTYSDPFI